MGYAECKKTMLEDLLDDVNELIKTEEKNIEYKNKCDIEDAENRIIKGY